MPVSIASPLRCLVVVLAFILPLTACRDSTAAKDRPVPDLSQIQANLAFTCAYEKDAIPPRDKEADQLYKHARWLRKNNLLKEDPAVYPKIERLIRIATAYGHDKANLELRQMIGKGQADSDDSVKETLDLTEDLIKRGIPGGYYDMGRYLENGYGVKPDAELALKYYRKSADLGSPEGQYLVGEKLYPKAMMAFDIAVQMYKCAAEQGHGEAAVMLGNVYSEISKNYPEATLAFQLGAKAGNASSARFLQHGFEGPSPEEMYYLDQQKDSERASRYKAIAKVLSDYSYLNPKVPELDQIVPLPPAKLPPWDGKLQWLNEHEANVPPPLPPEERITEMARAKGLDPATGRPLPQKHSVAPAESSPVMVAAKAPLGTRLPSRSPCPQAGVWACDPPDTVGSSRRSFREGEILPQVFVAIERTAWQQLRNAPVCQLVDTAWTLAEFPPNTA
jgi:uncharacterized protein